MGWSREGKRLAATLVARLAADRPTLVVHSGVRRTRRLAEAVARATDCALAEDARWRERDFGSWEGRRWDAIWRETGDAMDGMLTDPHGYRPGGGETSAALAARAVAAWDALPVGEAVLVVAHGGPIAAVRAALAGAPLSDLARFIPACGAVVDASPEMTAR